jgi:hypothetical protein
MGATPASGHAARCLDVAPFQCGTSMTWGQHSMPPHCYRPQAHVATFAAGLHPEGHSHLSSQHDLSGECKTNATPAREAEPRTRNMYVRDPTWAVQALQAQRARETARPACSAAQHSAAAKARRHQKRCPLTGRVAYLEFLLLIYFSRSPPKRFQHQQACPRMHKASWARGRGQISG